MVGPSLPSSGGAAVAGFTYGTPFTGTAPGAVSLAASALPVLVEVADVQSAAFQHVVSHAFAAPLGALGQIALNALQRFPVLDALLASAVGSSSAHAQPALATVLALLQQRGAQHSLSAHSAGLGVAAVAASSVPPASAVPSSTAVPSRSYDEPLSALLPSLVAPQLSSLSRASFVRLLAASTAEELQQQQRAGLRTALLTALATRPTAEVGSAAAVVHTVRVPGRGALRALQSALARGASADDAELSALLSSLSLSSSLSDGALFAAVLSDVMTDLSARYDLALALLYRLMHTADRPQAELRVELRVGEDDDEAAEEETAATEDEQPQAVEATANAGAGDGEERSAPAGRKRRLPSDGLDDADRSEPAKALRRSGPVGEDAVDEEETAAQGADVVAERVWSAAALQQSPAFVSALSSFLHSTGGVEYGELLSALLAAFDSRLFVADAAQAEAAGADPQPSLFSARFARLFSQFLLDAPVLAPSVWATLERYLDIADKAPVALSALHALLTFRPPATARALAALLRVLGHSTVKDVRERSVRLAVELAFGRRASDSPCTAAIVDCALEMSAAAASPAFLADLPPIAVNISIPPPPVYEQIELKTADAAPPPAPSSAVLVGAASSSSGGDGSFDADEARRREIQALIAEATRRKKEFDKLVLRRALLLREKELVEAQATEREAQRSRRTEQHIDLLLALLRAAGSAASDGPAVRVHAPRLFRALLALYRGASSSDPARKVIHAALPAIVARVGPSEALLSALRSDGAGADACVLHCLQLLCNNPLEPSHPPFAIPTASASPSAASVLVYASSPVYALCWELYTARGGDGRFVIPVLPIARADVVRRCLHRLVLLPAAQPEGRLQPPPQAAGVAAGEGQ